MLVWILRAMTRRANILVVDRDVVVLKLFLYCLDAAGLEGLCSFRLGCFKDIPQFVLGCVDVLPPFAVVSDHE